MNQTQKRLNIIKLAISIGDNETIQLQMLKLAPLKTDRKIQEIHEANTRTRERLRHIAHEEEYRKKKHRNITAK